MDPWKKLPSLGYRGYKQVQEETPIVVMVRLVCTPVRRRRWPVLLHGFWTKNDREATDVVFRLVEACFRIRIWQRFEPPLVPAGLLRERGVTQLPADFPDDESVHVLLEPWGSMQLQLELYCRLREAHGDGLARRAFQVEGWRDRQACEKQSLGPACYRDGHDRVAACLDEAVRLVAKGHEQVLDWKRARVGACAVFLASERDEWAVEHQGALYWVGRVVRRQGRGIKLRWFKLDLATRLSELTQQMDVLGPTGFLGCACYPDAYECFVSVVA